MHQRTQSTEKNTLWNGRKVFENYISDKELIYRIYVELLRFKNSKKKKKEVKNEQKT